MGTIYKQNISYGLTSILPDEKGGIKMSVTLPLFLEPQLRENHCSAYPLSVLNTHKDFNDKWLLAQFTLLRYKTLLTYKQPFFMYWNCFNVKIYMLYRKKNILSIVKKALDQRYYVHLELNERYLPDRKASGKFDFMHDLLVYGYDDDLDFQTVAYNQKGIYVSKTIRQSDLEAAYLNCNHKFVIRLFVFRIKPNYDFHSVTNKDLLRQLEKAWHPCNRKTGLNSYNCLIKDIDFHYQKNLDLDLRSFRTLYEHACLLILLQNYLHLSEPVIQKLVENKQRAEVIFNLAKLSTISKKETIHQKIVRNILLYQQAQRWIFQQILDC